MYKILYILPFRYNKYSQERLDIILYVIKNLVHNFYVSSSSTLYKVDIGVIEQDTQPFLNEHLEKIHKNIIYEFAFNDSLFHRPWAFNIMFRQYPHYDAYVLADGDALMNPKDFDEIFSLMANDRSIECCFRPKIFADLTEKATKRIISENKIPFDSSLITTNDFDTHRNNIAPPAAAFCVFSKIGIDKIHWCDENFIGWGGDDDAVALAAKKLNLKCGKHNVQYLYHLYHSFLRTQDPTFIRNYRYLIENYIHKSIPPLTSIDLKGHKDRHTKK